MNKPLRVLIVEDVEEDALLLVRELQRGGYEPVYERVDTLAAMQAALEQKPWDIIFSDHAMPHFSSPEALQALQARGLDIPFILVSGSIGEDAVAACLKAGAHDYLLKGKYVRLIPAVERELREVEVRQACKRAEERVREQAALLDKANDAIFVQDLRNHITFWNQGAERLYGWLRAEAIGQNAHELLGADTTEGLAQAIRTLLDTGEWSGELAHTTKDGRDVTVESRWTLVRDDNGRPEAKLIINNDITEKKRLEGKFLRAQRLESIGSLAGGIAHDLNNILTPMLMAVEFLKMDPASTERTEFLETIRAGIDRGAGMVKQILSLARGLDGRRSPVFPGPVIKEVGTMVVHTFPKSIECRVQVPDDLCAIEADATQITQVILNLCINARDAMPEGGTLTVSAENFAIDEHYAQMHPEARPGPYVVVRVADTGTGIPQAIIDRIFEPFFTTKEPGKGTGLGLASVQEIVKAHGGFLAVYSESGQGTRFTVHLPAIEMADVGMEETAAAALPGHGETLLIVDDEASVREMMRATLEANGYRVVTAGDGTEAIARYAEHRDEIQAVLTDMVMPVMDGPATIRALQRMNSKVRVIAVSGLPTAAKAAERLGVGEQAFLEKPYRADKLLKTIREVLSATLAE